MPFQEYQRARNNFTASPVPIQFLSSKLPLHSAHSFLSSGIQSADYYGEKKTDYVTGEGCKHGVLYWSLQDRPDINHVQRL